MDKGAYEWEAKEIYHQYYQQQHVVSAHAFQALEYEYYSVLDRRFGPSWPSQAIQSTLVDTKWFAAWQYFTLRLYDKPAAFGLCCLHYKPFWRKLYSE